MKLKQWQNIFHMIANVNPTYNSNQKYNNKTCQCEFKYYHKCIKDYTWNLITYICENSKYIGSIADISVIKCERRQTL